MKKFFQIVGLLTVLGVGASLVSAYTGLSRASKGFIVREISVAAGSTVYGNDPSVMMSLGMTHYNEVCWKREDIAVGELIFMANSDVGEADAQGWPFVGTEKECHDWDQSVQLHFWTDGLGTQPKLVKLLFIE
jgi:hypothetical protein